VTYAREGGGRRTKGGRHLTIVGGDPDDRGQTVFMCKGWGKKGPELLRDFIPRPNRGKKKRFIRAAPRKMYDYQSQAVKAGGPGNKDQEAHSKEQRSKINFPPFSKFRGEPNGQALKIGPDPYSMLEWRGKSCERSKKKGGEEQLSTGSREERLENVREKKELEYRKEDLDKNDDRRGCQSLYRAHKLSIRAGFL